MFEALIGVVMSAIYMEAETKGTAAREKAFTEFDGVVKDLLNAIYQANWHIAKAVNPATAIQAAEVEALQAKAEASRAAADWMKSLTESEKK
ncbi:hypothetical protein CCC_02936 [Paramagnetospirillum magnetotacticum MS-1]|uniref:Uncharacterized protein n=1 Tax=Paramagnetospirillum magnetotacticum MS-1 TaxID=272627 RepID=A0A0C2UF79_PARME|nr:hypothetical protein CCC_02936 [Paramagnetospirillum magnetotacticum MS-1]